MSRWLIKSDPGEYSAVDLERDRKTLWTGVRNPQAQLHLRAMALRDSVLIYHTGSQKAIVAVATVVSRPIADPTDEQSKCVAVEVRFESWLERPVTLSEIRSDASSFPDFALLKFSRLSVLPVRAGEWEHILKMAEGSRP